MRSRTIESLPFDLDRASPTGLVEQFVGAMRKAVADGMLRAGDVLPGFRQMARELGVSLRVFRDAVPVLCADGVLATRRGVGTVVVGRKRAAAPRRTLFVVYQDSHGCFYTNVFVERVVARLTACGFRIVVRNVQSRSLGRDWRKDLQQALRESQAVAGLVLSADDWIFDAFVDLGLPYVACNYASIRFKGAVGYVRFSSVEPLEELVQQCVQCGVRRVWQFLLEPTRQDVAEMLRVHWIAVETEVVPGLMRQADKLAYVQRKAFETMTARLVRGDLPDLIYFADDFIAMGAIMALLAHGVRIPDDVRVVTWANAGFGPVAPMSLTRLEMDPVADADAVSAALEDYMRTGKFPKRLVLRPKFVPGESLV